MYVEKQTEFVKDENLKEHPILRGFFQSNEAPEIYLSKKGRVWNEIRETFIKVKPSKYGYPCFNSLKVTYQLHVLLAELFLIKLETNKDLEVNHKDGNKNNYSLDNLEWVTRRENVLHALQTGLISKCRYKLLSKDIETGEVVEHESLNDCARYIGCCSATVSYYLRRTPTALLKGRYDVILSGNRWNSFSEKDLGRPGLGKPRSVIVFNLESKTIVIYHSTKEASEHTGVCRSEIAARASGYRSSVAKGYRFMWLDEYKESVDGIPVIDENATHQKKANPNFKRKERPIRVTFGNGEKEDYSGCSILANSLKVSKDALQYAIRANNGKFKDMQISYL